MVKRIMSAHWTFWGMAVLVFVTVGCRSTETRLPTTGLSPSEDTATSVTDTKIRQYRDLAREFPDEPKYQERLARLYWSKKDHKSAIRYVRSAQRLAPSDPRYHYLEGRIYYGIGNYTDAEKCYKQVVELSGDEFTGPYFELAYLYLLQDRIDEGKKLLERCLEIDPKFSLPYYHLAEIAALRNQKEKAVEHYETFLRLSGGVYQDQVLQRLYELQPDVPRAQRIRFDD